MARFDKGYQVTKDILWLLTKLDIYKMAKVKMLDAPYYIVPVNDIYKFTNRMYDKWKCTDE